jgi:dienelactone hydrolase
MDNPMDPLPQAVAEIKTVDLRMGQEAVMVRNLFALVFLLAGLFAGSAVGVPADEGQESDLQHKAQAFVDLLSKGAFAQATKNFDATMQRVLPVDKLEGTWTYQTGLAGVFQRQLGLRSEKRGKYTVVHVDCQFERYRQDVLVSFDAEGHIAGLFFVPGYQAPAYVRQSSLREQDVTIGNGEWQLRGTLTLPAGVGPFPAVVLVHGSGPQDRDESIGPNKPFRDLAEGLTTNGVAVLRYEKRTKAHGAKMVAAGITIREETIDDALAAVALLRRTPGIDPKKIFVLGHSLGGTCAPRIGQLDPGIGGLILLAGSNRPFEEVLVEQFDYILSLGGMPEDKRKGIEKQRQQAADMKSLKLTPETPAAQLPLGLTAGYLLSLRECDPKGIVAKIQQPVLVLQGERDYQVTMEDFRGWQQALQGRSNATYKTYANLNHCFMEGVGKARPEEYVKAGHVAQEVIVDIAAWIKKQ